MGNFINFVASHSGLLMVKLYFKRKWINWLKKKNCWKPSHMLITLLLLVMIKKIMTRTYRDSWKLYIEKKLTLNEAQTKMSVPSINILGYQVGNGSIKPDPERLRPLQEFPSPMNLRSLRRTLGMFAYYAKWIPHFSDKIRPLVDSKTFPLDDDALVAFNSLKKELEQVTLCSIDESLSFVVECDASEVAVSATLNQGGHPVAFMS